MSIRISRSIARRARNKAWTENLYKSATAYKQTVWKSGFLTQGNHTVKIERLGTKNASSSGYTIDLDAVDVIGALR